MSNKQNFWSNKKVLITGHTGFKGSWLTLWLTRLGAKVVGYSLSPPTKPSIFEVAKVEDQCISCIGDIYDFSKLVNVIHTYQPEVIFHMAAQALVRPSYRNPVDTFLTNVMGTVHVLEAARKGNSVRVIINVTSDKCYLNQEGRTESFKESDCLGGHDPYSASKACAEIISSSYKSSFFSEKDSVHLASVRAGNVIGGGDWADNRLIPDLIRAIKNEVVMRVRNPHAVRPWQHVLEPLSGYLMLAERLWSRKELSGGWNFGPSETNSICVEEFVKKFQCVCGKQLKVTFEKATLYEAPFLNLNSSKARKELLWNPKLSFDQSLQWTIDWYNHYDSHSDMQLFTYSQIETYCDMYEGSRWLSSSN